MIETKTSKQPDGQKIIKTVLKELRLLRQYFSLFIPKENLSDFKNKDEIVSSYKKALKQFPPSSEAGSAQIKSPPGHSAR